MTTVRHILLSKGTDVWSVQPHTLVFDALKVMAEKNVGALLVMDGGRLAGIFTERDYARKLVLQGESSLKTQVKDVMSTHLTTVTEGSSVDECMALMTEKRIRHLPVLSDDKVIGMVSIGDVVKEIIYEHKDTIHHLENYITGSR